MKQRFFIVFIILRFLSPFGFSQYYETGQAPASFSWRSIQTSSFRVLYPSDYEKKAREFTALLEGSLDLLEERFDHSPAPFTVVINNHSALSNGYVTWAPKRMEIYPAAEQNAMPMDPLEQLALHELTHIFQIDKMKTGASRFLSYLFGEQFTGGLTVYLPRWYLEGDAILSETAYSLSGRGRQPDFLNRIPALLLESEKKPGYDRLLLGSYKDHIPDHYHLGYYLTAFSQAKNNAWPGILEYTGKNPWSLNPVNQGMKKYAGLTKKKLYDLATDDLLKSWDTLYHTSEGSATEHLTPKTPEVYTVYRSPHILPDGSVVALKTSLQYTTSIVQIHQDTGEEKILHKPGVMQYPLISAAGNLITWAEYQRDLRWRNRSYSVIKVYNLNNGQEKTLGRKDRLFAPALSPDAGIIAAVRSTPNQKNSMVLIDASSGKTIREIPSPGNRFLQRPEWTQDGNALVFISLSPEGEGILRYSLPDARWETLLQHGNRDIQSCTIQNGRLLVSIAHENSYSICSVQDAESLISLAENTFGFYDLQWHEKTLYFAEYSSSGYSLGRIPANGLKPSGSKALELNYEDNALVKTYRQGKLLKEEYAPATEYRSTPYRKALHELNFHSWMPFYINPFDFEIDLQAISPGLTLLSQNLLSTSFLSLGYEYTAGEHLFHTEYEYKGLYPAFRFSFDYGGTPDIRKNDPQDPDPSSVEYKKSFSAEIFLPLNLTSNRYMRSFYPSLKMSYTTRYLYQPEEQVYDAGQWFAQPRLYFSNLQRLAHRNIYPRWGQVIDAYTVFSPVDKYFYGGKYTLSTRWYFPGFYPNHSIFIKAGAEEQDPKRYVYYNSLFYPRGVTDKISEKLTSLQLNYTLPLMYPDLAVGPLLYIKRLRLNLFYDSAKGKKVYDLTTESFTEESRYFRSAGADLTADIHTFRIPFPLNTGIRAGYIPDRGDFFFRFLFNIDIFGFSINRDTRFLQ